MRTEIGNGLMQDQIIVGTVEWGDCAVPQASRRILFRIVMQMEQPISQESNSESMLRAFKCRCFAGKASESRKAVTDRRMGSCPFYLCITILLPLAAAPAMAQEALQNSLAGEAAASSRSQQFQSSQGREYTFKYGDYQMLLQPSLGVDWNDNVYLSHNNALNDYILEPALHITASYPVSQRDLLYLDVTVGYDRYLLHPALSTFELNASSGTGLSFDLAIKNFTINLHDWLSYVQDSAQSATVANTANYGTFQNTAGLSGTWNLDQVLLSLGYDHQNVFSTSAQYNDLDRAAEMLVARAGFQVHPKVTVGLESTASFTTYDEAVFNNNQAYTIGPYAEFRSGKYLRLSARGGYATYQFQRTSATVQTSNQNTWYAGLNLSDQLRPSMHYSLEGGREEELGDLSDLMEDWYARLNINWKIIKSLDVTTGFFYEHGNQGVGNVAGNFTETFDWYGGTLSLQHALTSRITLGLNYRLTLRSSSIADDGYAQNLVGLQITYHPK
jgi:Putative beta-barrel porin 2